MNWAVAHAHKERLHGLGWRFIIMTLRRSKRVAQRRARSPEGCDSAWSSNSARSSGLSEAEESDSAYRSIIKTTPVVGCSKVSRSNNFIKV